MSTRARFVLLTALRWAPVGFLAPVYVLLMQARGLSLTGIGAVMITYTVTVIALELPTGGLADSVGARRVLIIGSCFGIAFLTGLLFAHGQLAFMALAVAHGTERALRSGPLEGWFVDRELACGRETELTGGLSAAAIAEAVALGVGALGAGLLPLLTPDVARGGTGVVSVLTLPVLAALACEALHLGASLALVSPARTTREHTGDARLGVRVLVRAGIRDATTHPALRRLLGATAAIGIALCSVELLWQPRLAELLGDPGDHTLVFGVLGATAFFAAAIGAVFAPRIGEMARSQAAAAMYGTVAYGAALIALTVPIGAPTFGVVYGATYLLQGSIGPLHRTLLHSHAPVEARVTLLSVDSLLLMAGGLLGAAVLPMVAETFGIGAAWLTAGAVVLASAPAYAGLSRRVGADTGPVG